MKLEHKELIYDYLNLDKHIKRTSERLDLLVQEFSSQNYCGRTDFSVLGVKTIGFRVDSQVSAYVDALDSYNEKLERLERKKQYFRRYLESLDHNTYKSLKRRYGHYRALEEAQELGHDEKVLDEILEIEQAISYEFNLELPDDRNKELIQIENAELTNETLENSFDMIAGLLGV